MATMTNGSVRIFHGAHHYRTAPYGQKRTSGIHKGTDYGTSGIALPQYPPLDGAIVKQVVNVEKNGDARGCRVRLEWPHFNLGMILQHLVEGSVSVKVGQVLTKDDRIGLTGMTGKYSNGTRVSTGVHCHVEVYDIKQSPNAPSSLATFDFETTDYNALEASVKKEDEPVTYEQFVEFMKKYETEKSKLPQSDWSTKEGYFDKATKEGVLDGTSPQSYATREMVTAILGRKNLI